MPPFFFLSILSMRTKHPDICLESMLLHIQIMQGCKTAILRKIRPHNNCRSPFVVNNAGQIHEGHIPSYLSGQVVNKNCMIILKLCNGLRSVQSVA